MENVRIDKWLWAARFFKTRNLAKQAIEGGKVHLESQRIKASKEIKVGLMLSIRQGWEVKHVMVKALSEQRKAAPQAALLYEETAQSLAMREQKSAERKAAGDSHPHQDGRPTKKQRRQIHRFVRTVDQTN